LFGQADIGSQGGIFDRSSQSAQGESNIDTELKRAELDKLRRQREERNRRAQEERDRRAQAQQAELERLSQMQAAANQAYQEQVEKRVKQMQGYAKGLYTDWANIPTQSYVAGVFAPAKMMEVQSGNTKVSIVEKDGKEVVVQEKVAQDNTANAPKKKMIKAGTIVYGVIDTAINSDEPSPVLATIVHGKLKGGKLIGNVTKPANGEKVILNFSTMTLPTHDSSLGVSAVAVDANTARTALATKVNRHYLLRYGALFASSFLEGYGKVIADQGATTISSTDGSTVTNTKPTLSSTDELWAAASTVGQEFTNAIRPFFNTPVTITVDAGTSIGILFTSDLDVTPQKG